MLIKINQFVKETIVKCLGVKCLYKLLSLLLVLALLLPMFSFSSAEPEVSAGPDEIPYWTQTSEEETPFDLDALREKYQPTLENGVLMRQITDPEDIAMMVEQAGIDHPGLIVPEIDKQTSFPAMIILEATSVIEKMNGIQLQQLTQQAEYQALMDESLQRQIDVHNAIENALDQTVPINRRFHHFVNAYSVDLTPEELALVRQVPGVKSAFFTPSFKEPEIAIEELPELFDEEIPRYFVSSAELINLEAMWNEGYKGQQKVFAIIDTGLALNNLGFTQSPEQPRLTKDNIITLLDSFEFNAEEMLPTFTADQAYKSEKIPFVFDYSEKDADVLHTGVSPHGTHVAGIVASNPVLDDSLYPHAMGVAPESQIVVLKVFGREASGASFDDILAAMEDAVLLGVDGVNLSLGAPAGFDTAEDIEPIFDAARDAGVQIVVSAGNDYHTGMRNFTGVNKNMTIDPDSGVVGTPSVFESALSIASSQALNKPDWANQAM